MVFATFFDLPTILVGVAQQFFWVKILESCEKWHWLPIFISSTSQNMWSILVVENGVCDFGRSTILVGVAQQFFWVKFCEKL
jgi:hypothetical protein